MEALDTKFHVSEHQLIKNFLKDLKKVIV